VAAALRLLDDKGLGAVTMRSVAQAAGTTTPTLYGRFSDREAMLAGVVKQGETELLAIAQAAPSVTKLATEVLHYFCMYPLRFDLMVETFVGRLVASSPTPVYDVLMARLRSETGLRGRQHEDAALAIAALVIGTARGMIAAGPGTNRAKELKRASASALKLLLSAFSEAKLRGR
jgi:AcrR family transcriptional regulator